MAIIIPQEESKTVSTPRLQAFGDETTFGGGSGLQAENEQVQKIAESTFEIGAFEKVRADQTAVQGASAQLAAIHSKLLSDPNEGLPAYKGVNAMDGHDKIMAEYQKHANELAKGLQPAQQGAFNRIAIQQGDVLNQHAMAYVNNQLEQHDTNTFQAVMKNNAENASKYYGNDDAVGILKNQTDLIAQARAKRLGLGPEQTEDFMRTVQSNFHEQVLSQMVNDPNFQKKAQNYFDQNKGEMDAASQERISKWIGDGSIKSQSNQLAAEAMNANPKSESAALARADKVADPDVRSMARQIISAQFSQNRAADKNDKEQTFMAVQDQITKAGLTDPVDIRQAIKPTDWTNMTGAQRQAILKSGQDNVTSPRMWADYSQAIADGSISLMTRGDLHTKFLQFASLSDQKQILKTWAEGQKDTKNLSHTKTFNQMVDQAAIDSKIVNSVRKDNWSEDEYRNWKLLGDEAQQRIEATERATGKKLTPTNQQELINNLVIDHTFEKKGWFGSTSQEFEPYTKQFSAQVLSKFPDASEDQIAKAYRMVRNGSKQAEVEAFLKAK